jgi:hypothetical protein
VSTRRYPTPRQTAYTKRIPNCTLTSSEAKKRERALEDSEASETSLAMSQPQPAATVDLVALKSLRTEIQSMRDQMKVKQANVAAIESMAISTLLRLNKRYVGMQQGTGNYICLSKKTSEGSWNTERYKEFLATVINPHLAQGLPLTADFFVREVEKYLDQFQKRSLSLTMVSRQPRENTCEDLVAWLNGRDEPTNMQ